MAKSSLGKADRYYLNPVLRDEEWFVATQAPWWLLSLAVIVVAAGFFCGVYAERPYNILGWIVGVVMIAIYLILGSGRRRRARQRLRELHGQTNHQAEADDQAQTPGPAPTARQAPAARQA